MTTKDIGDADFYPDLATHLKWKANAKALRTVRSRERHRLPCIEDEAAFRNLAIGKISKQPSTQINVLLSLV
jgi:hypothetical protein